MDESDWSRLVDQIRTAAHRLSETDLPDDLTVLDAGRKHLRLANRDLWRVIDRAEQQVFEAQWDVIDAVWTAAPGGAFAGELRRLVEQGIVELRADARRLRRYVTDRTKEEDHD
jgi:hypothetical protein